MAPRIHIDQAVQNQKNIYLMGQASDIELLQGILQRTATVRMDNILLKIFAAAEGLFDTRKEAAEFLGVNEHTFGRYLRGDRSPFKRIGPGDG